MTDAAISVLAGSESHADHGWLANALEAASEFVETDGDDIKLIFGDAGVQGVPEPEDPDSDYADLFETIREHAAVCVSKDTHSPPASFVRSWGASQQYQARS